MHIGEFEHGARGERRFAIEQFDRGAGQRILIGGGRHGLPAQYLGCRVGQRCLHDGPPWPIGMGEFLGDAEIGEYGAARVRAHDVGRLDVAMYDLFVVYVVQGSGDLLQQS
ncbi:Uncharacterised protein [Mycobacteroides abscessus subsp. abscessus]|nr:Uncharacterised protein [Mycobacteroides abscessus subsp. abscessus]